ncbi:hypothetical protein Hanom_Chr07g00667151 [Helianthus anomalus]
MDGVNELDENSKIPILLDSNAKKTNLWTKVAKVAKPHGRKWHFTLLFFLVTTRSRTSGLQGD